MFDKTLQTPICLKQGAKSVSKQRRFAHLLHVTPKTHGKYTSDFFKNAVKDMVLVHHTPEKNKVWQIFDPVQTAPALDSKKAPLSPKRSPKSKSNKIESKMIIK